MTWEGVARGAGPVQPALDGDTQRTAPGLGSAGVRVRPRVVLDDLHDGSRVGAQTICETTCSSWRGLKGLDR